jgi:predicted transcriptional regulator
MSRYCDIAVMLRYADIVARVTRTPKQIGAWVANRREQLGLTQAEVAERAHVSRQLVGRVEAGALRAELWAVIAVVEAVGGLMAVEESGAAA